MDKMPASGYHLGMPMLFRVGGVDYKKIAEYAREHPEDMTPHTGVPPDDFDGINYASVCGFGGWTSLVRAAKERGWLPKDWKSGWGREGFSVCGVSPYAIKNGLAYFDIVHIFKRSPYNAEDITEAEYEAREKIRDELPKIRMKTYSSVEFHWGEGGKYEKNRLVKPVILFQVKGGKLVGIGALPE